MYNCTFTNQLDKKHSDSSSCIAVLFNISCFYFLFFLVSGPVVIGHSCYGVPANVLSFFLTFENTPKTILQLWT